MSYGSGIAALVAFFWLLSYVIAGLGVPVLWYRNRQHQEYILTIPLLILIALLMGPITWDHYASWALVPLISMADRRLWANRSAHTCRRISLALFIGAVLLATPTLYLAPMAVTQLWWLRLLTGTKTLGLLLWFGSAVCLLRQPPQSTQLVTYRLPPPLARPRRPAA